MIHLLTPHWKEKQWFCPENLEKRKQWFWLHHIIHKFLAWYNVWNCLNLPFLLFPTVKDALTCVKIFIFILSLYISKDYSLWLKIIFFSRRKITNIPWTPHIMLIKFLSFSHSVCQGKGQPSVLCCSVGWLSHRVVSGGLLAEHVVLLLLYNSS